MEALPRGRSGGWRAARPSRAQECLKRGARAQAVAWAEAGKYGASPWDGRQGSRNISRPAPGAMRRGGLTFELWEVDDGHGGRCGLHFLRKKPLFPDGLPPWELAVC